MRDRPSNEVDGPFGRRWERGTDYFRHVSGFFAAMTIPLACFDGRLVSVCVCLTLAFCFLQLHCKLSTTDRRAMKERIRRLEERVDRLAH